MRLIRPLVFSLAVLLLLSTAFAADSWQNATIVDVSCAAKVKANPDAHPVSCALQCAAKGLGIYTADGAFLKLDARGTQQAVAILKRSHKKAGVHVNVTGEREGDTIRVQSIKVS